MKNGEIVRKNKMENQFNYNNLLSQKPRGFPKRYFPRKFSTTWSSWTFTNSSFAFLSFQASPSISAPKINPKNPPDFSMATTSRSDHQLAHRHIRKAPTTANDSRARSSLAVCRPTSMKVSQQIFLLVGVMSSWSSRFSTSVTRQCLLWRNFPCWFNWMFSEFILNRVIV